MRIIINDNIFKPIVRYTKKGISDGMKGKNFDSTFNSMLFIMGEEKNQSFWMYECITDLDIIMIDSNNIITKIHHNCEPCVNINECDTYNGFGDKVIELPGGNCKYYDIKKGDRVSFYMK